MSLISYPCGLPASFSVSYLTEFLNCLWSRQTTRVFVTHRGVQTESFCEVGGFRYYLPFVYSAGPTPVERGFLLIYLQRLLELNSRDTPVAYWCSKTQSFHITFLDPWVKFFANRSPVQLTRQSQTLTLKDSEGTLYITASTAPGLVAGVGQPEKEKAQAPLGKKYYTALE